MPSSELRNVQLLPHPLKGGAVLQRSTQEPDLRLKLAVGKTVILQLMRLVFETKA